MNHEKQNRKDLARKPRPTIRSRRPDAAAAFLDGHEKGLAKGYERGKEEGYMLGHLQGLEDGIQVGVGVGFDGALSVVNEVAACVRSEGGTELRKAAIRRAVEKGYIAMEDLDDSLTV